MTSLAGSLSLSTSSNISSVFWRVRDTLESSDVRKLPDSIPSIPFPMPPSSFKFKYVSQNHLLSHYTLIHLPHCPTAFYITLLTSFFLSKWLCIAYTKTAFLLTFKAFNHLTPTHISSFILSLGTSHYIFFWHFCIAFYSLFNFYFIF